MTDGVFQWKLSEFNLGKEYIDMKRLGKERVSGTAAEVTIAFDDVSSRHRQFDNISSNNLKLAPTIFPYVNKMDQKEKFK